MYDPCFFFGFIYRKIEPLSDDRSSWWIMPGQTELLAEALP